MELTELVRVAVVQDMKKNARDFLGKDEYKVSYLFIENTETSKPQSLSHTFFRRCSIKLGDISKEIDDRVKTEVAKVRGKDDYELGDFVLAMDEMSKSMTEVRFDPTTSDPKKAHSSRPSILKSLIISKYSTCVINVSYTSLTSPCVFLRNLSYLKKIGAHRKTL